MQANPAAVFKSSPAPADPFSDVLYASISTLAPKLKVVEMDSPSAVVEMRASGLISWEWTFIWEEQRYSWRRDIVGMTSERGYTLLVVRIRRDRKSVV